MGSETPKPTQPPSPTGLPSVRPGTGRTERGTGTFSALEAPGSAGVLQAPGRLSGPGQSFVASSLILAVGVGFWFLRAPLSAALDRLLPFTAETTDVEGEGEGNAPESRAGEGLASETDGSVGDPGAAASTVPKRVAEPERPSWTLLQVTESLETAGFALEALIRQGRDELGELEDPDGASEARAERTRRIWTNWGRTWRNRLQVIASTLPPPEACAVHAAMEPACNTLRQVLTTLDSVPIIPSTEVATAGLDEAATTLDLLLNPPEEDLEEEEGEETESDEGTDSPGQLPTAQGRGKVPSYLAMMPSMISSAPPPIESRRQSRKARATGDSHI